MSILTKNSIPSLYSNKIRPKNFGLNKNSLKNQMIMTRLEATKTLRMTIQRKRVNEAISPLKGEKSLNKVVNFANISVPTSRDHSIRCLSVDFDNKRILKSEVNVKKLWEFRVGLKRNRQSFVLSKAKVSSTRECSISKVEENIQSVTIFPELDLSSCIQSNFKDKSTQIDFQYW